MDFIMQLSVWTLMEILAHVQGAVTGFNFLLLLPGYVSGTNSVRILVHKGICLWSLIPEIKFQTGNDPVVVLHPSQDTCD